MATNVSKPQEKHIFKKEWDMHMFQIEYKQEYTKEFTKSTLWYKCSRNCSDQRNMVPGRNMYTSQKWQRTREIATRK